MTSISEKAQLLSVLQQELDQLETLQLRVGNDMSKLVFDQMRLAEKSLAIINTMEKIIKS